MNEGIDEKRFYRKTRERYEHGRYILEVEQRLNAVIFTHLQSKIPIFQG